MKKKMYPHFALSVAGHGFISTKKEEKTESIHREQLRQSTLDSNLTQARIHSLSWTEIDTYARVTQLQWLQDKLALSKAVLEEQEVHFAGISHRARTSTFY